MVWICLILFIFWLSSAEAAPLVCGGVDDTLALQSDIDRARIARGGIIQLPFGTCRVRALNGRNLIGVRIEGITSFGSILAPLESGGIMFDLTDSFDITLTRFTLGNPWQPTTHTPLVGLLTAHADLATPSSNLIHLDQLVISGTFGWAAWINLGVTSSTVIRSQFYNFSPGIGTVVFVAYNWMGLTSPFGPLMTGNSGPTDWTFLGSEIHNFGGGAALWLGGADSLRFFGGNISVNLGFPHFVDVNVAGTIPTGPNLIFDGTTFYTDDGSRPRCLVQSNQGPLPVRVNSLGIPAGIFALC